MKKHVSLPFQARVTLVRLLLWFFKKICFPFFSLFSEFKVLSFFLSLHISTSLLMSFVVGNPPKKKQKNSPRLLTWGHWFNAGTCCCTLPLPIFLMYGGCWRITVFTFLLPPLLFSTTLYTLSHFYYYYAKYCWAGSEATWSVHTYTYISRRMWCVCVASTKQREKKKERGLGCLRISCQFTFVFLLCSAVGCIFCLLLSIHQKVFHSFIIFVPHLKIIIALFLRYLCNRTNTFWGLPFLCLPLKNRICFDSLFFFHLYH